MELALSLGDRRKQSLQFLDKPSKINPSSSSSDKDLGFRMGFGGRSSSSSVAAAEEDEEEVEKAAQKDFRRDSNRLRVGLSSPPLQLDLLPFSPVPRSNPPNQLRFPWLPESIRNETGSSEIGPGGKILDPNRISGMVAAEEAAVRLSASPPNSVTSSFQLDFGIRSHGDGMGKGVERSGSRASDDDENGLTRKKLRLSKEQSAFLEESFKEHNTLNPVSGEQAKPLLSS